MKKLRKFLIIASASAFICAAGTILAVHMSLPPECTAEQKLVHVSIDDCWQAMARLCQPELRSVFDDPFFRQLKKWHDDYDAKFTCYVFGKSGDFSLKNVPTRFRKEFEKSASWLKFGFHAYSSDIEKTRIQSKEEFARNFEEVNAAIDSFAGTESRTTTLRLDYFFAREDWKPLFRQNEIEVLLGADTPGRISYVLDASRSAQLWDDGYLSNETGGGI